MEIKRKAVLVKIMFFAIFIALLHYIALKFYLYWTNSWIDIPMHILGGAIVSLIGLWAIYFSPLRKTFLNSPKKIIYLSIFIAFIVGIFWEFFEIYFDLISRSLSDRVDSVKDMFNDIIGALIVSYYFIRKVKSELFHKNGEIGITKKNLWQE